ncbi:hypothetical protein ZWY2020_025248, partial [Hordeum vulgare]
CKAMRQGYGRSHTASITSVDWHPTRQSMLLVLKTTLSGHIHSMIFYVEQFALEILLIVRCTRRAAQRPPRDEPVSSSMGPHDIPDYLTQIDPFALENCLVFVFVDL